MGFLRPPPACLTNEQKPDGPDPGRQRVLDAGVFWFASPGPTQLRHVQHTAFVEHHLLG